jgi:formate dehydrogenase maturation protein FdhE
MARKKCKECLGCFSFFWIDGERYYHCVLCKTTWKGRDSELVQCEDPRIRINVPVIMEEQEDETQSEL